jgi:alkylation response protein AidB-like acyl-CoA dehydrogenase
LHCLSSVTKRAKGLVQHGKPIGKHQLIQRYVANMAMNLEIARWLTYVVAQEKMDLDKEPENMDLRSRVDRESAIAKRVASRLTYESAIWRCRCSGASVTLYFSPVEASLRFASCQNL